MLVDKNWAIINIKFIRTSETHHCIRKLDILAKNGIDELEMNFHPCTRFCDLETTYQQQHQLNPPCS